MKKSLSLHLTFLSISLLLMPVFASGNQEALNSSIKDTMNHHLASFPAPVAVEKKPKSDSEKTFWERMSNMEEPTFSITSLSKYEQVALSYNLMAPSLNALHEGILHPKCSKDLEIFFGGTKKEINLLQLLNKTHLTDGEVYLGALLSHPLTNTQELQHRQAIIRSLIENDSLREKLSDLFEEFAPHHKAIVSFWGTEQQTTKLFIDTQYYSFKPLTPLNTNAPYQHVAMTWNTLIYPTMIVAPLAATSYYVTAPVLTNSQLRNNSLVLGYTAFLNAYIGFLSYLMYDQVDKIIKTLSYLHEKSIGMARIVTTIDAVQKRIQDLPEFEHLQNAQVFTDFSKTRGSLSRKMKELLPLLRTSTFKGKPRFFALQGRVRKAYALISQIKEELLPALTALAELDAYLSCATLYKEYEGKENAFVFATYLEQTTPSITMEGMWNPFVGSEKSVANSIHLGGTSRKNVILTGPNAGGKSTFAKGLTLNVILAQTLGIVPAKSFALTPFSKISTYMNITDDTAGGNSLFKSEVMRAQELLNIISDLPKTQFAFSVMDEMFSGTSPKEGEAASYAVAKNLGVHANTITIIATHYPLMKELEQVTADFKNYQVRVVRHDNGTFSYPFKLEEGAADQNVAIDILKQEGFESSILSDAHEILNRPQVAATP